MLYNPDRKAAQQLGIHQNTLRQYADEGRIQVIRTASGQSRYDVDAYLRESTAVALVCYCRVSSAKQREDLDRQIAFRRERYPNAEIVSAVGGGLNFKQRGLGSLLERLHRGAKLRIVAAHRDRLARFGFELIPWLAEQNGGSILVLSQQDYSINQKLTPYFLAILPAFSCRLYGPRRYRNPIQADPGLSNPAASGVDPTVD